MISIIIPIYNVEDYIEKCISSVIQQTYQGEMECLLVDDCGTDGSMKIVEKLISRSTGTIQFQILHHIHNQGLSAARNTGICAAKGDWIYFLDSDDYITPDCIELLVKKSEEYPLAQIIQGGAVTDSGQPIQVDMEGDSAKVCDYMDDFAEIKSGILLNNTCYAGNVWNKLIKRDFILNHNLFFREGIIYEDAHWQFFVAKHLTAVAFVRKYTYVYITNENGIMRGQNFYNNLRSLNSWIIMAEDFIGNLDESCYEEQIVRILSVIIPVYTSSRYEAFIEKSRYLLKETIKKCHGVIRFKVSLLFLIPKKVLKRKFFFHFIVSRKFI